VGLQLSPLSDKILLPLSPTISGIIANYLGLTIEQFRDRLLQECDNAITEPSSKLPWQKYIDPDTNETVVTLNVICGESIRLVPTSQYQYVSTIARRLATKFGVTPQEFCQNLQIPVAILPADRLSELEVNCWYNAAGYIYFEITPLEISRWLAYIRDLPVDICSNRDRSVLPTSAVVNMAIYAHARCCSVLKLAQRQKLVDLTDRWNISKFHCSIDFANSTPERREDRLTSNLELDPEQQLIRVLMAILDAIHQLNGRSIDRQLPNWQQLTILLAQSWLEFYRHCRIFGDLQRQNPQLAAARCGLTEISRRYLQLLLENYLGVMAMEEL
jgi:hypothetical protein